MKIQINIFFGVKTVLWHQLDQGLVSIKMEFVMVVVGQKKKDNKLEKKGIFKNIKKIKKDK